MAEGSSAPIVLLDFDGVLNAFPEAIGVRYEDVGVAPVVECRGRMTDDCLLSSCGSPLWRVVSVRRGW